MDYMNKEEVVENKSSEKGKTVAEKGKTVAEKKKEDAPVAQEPEAKQASVKQKTQLLLLLNNKAITSEEKNKMLENINTLDSERIEKAILKIKKVIDERQGQDQQAA